MPKFQVQIETEYPILFLSNASPDARFPDVTGDTFASASDDCIGFYVLSYVDGASLVTVTDEECDAGGKEVFAGVINALTGILTVSDSSNFRYLNIPVPAGAVSVRIWADHESTPEWVWVKLAEIRLWP